MNVAGTFQAVGIFLLACAAGGYVYRTETKPAPVPQPKVELSCPSQPAPVVNVAPPAPVQVPAPARVERAPAHARVAPARAKKPETAKTILRKRWSKDNG